MTVYMCMFFFPCHCACVCVCGVCYCWQRGGLDQLCGVGCVCVRVCVWACGGCVWEPRAPLFSYIVPLLLQTVNSTKDAQAIVEQDS